MKNKILSIILTLVCLLGVANVANAAENETNLIARESQQGQVLSSEDKVVTPMVANYGEVNNNGVRVRSSAGTSGTVLGLLYKGDEVAISDFTGRIYRDGYWWIYVMPINSNRASGWVAEQYITIYPN